MHARYKDRLMRLAKTVNRILVRKNRLTQFKVLMQLLRSRMDVQSLGLTLNYRNRCEIVQAFKQIHASRKTGEGLIETPSLAGRRLQEVVN